MALLGLSEAIGVSVPIGVIILEGGSRETRAASRRPLGRMALRQFLRSGCCWWQNACMRPWCHRGGNPALRPPIFSRYREGAGLQCISMLPRRGSQETYMAPVVV